jgi:hypothetical protein
LNHGNGAIELCLTGGQGSQTNDLYLKYNNICIIVNIIITI